MPSKDRTDVQTYDKLPRGQKQQIDLDRRAALKKAESAPKSRMGDMVVDVVRGVGHMARRNPPGTGSARADYTAGREKSIRDAKNRAEYKDLKSGPTKVFRVPEGKGMTLDEVSKLGEYKVDESMRHYKGRSNVGK